MGSRQSRVFKTPSGDSSSAARVRTTGADSSTKEQIVSIFGFVGHMSLSQFLSSATVAVKSVK